MFRWRTHKERSDVERHGGEDLVAFAEALHESAVEACGDAPGIVTDIQYDAHGVNFQAQIGEGDYRRVIITSR
jgi:hypothetical protein